MSIEIIAGKVGAHIERYVAQRILAKATEIVLKKDPFKCAVEQALKELRNEKPDDWVVLEEVYHNREKIFGKIEISDETTFRRILAENGVKPETSSKLYKKLTERFNEIIKETAQKNSEVFYAYAIKEFTNIGADTKEIVKVLNDIAQSEKIYLDRIIEYFEKLEKKEKELLHLSTIEFELKKGEIFEEKFFRHEGPLWIDFEKDYIVRRHEVDKIINNFEKGILRILLVGDAASGKSVIARNVGFDLSNKCNVFYFDSKEFETHKVDAIFNDILNLRAGSLVIIEDAHLYPEYCDHLIEDILRKEGIVIKILFTVRPTYNLYRQVRNLDENCKKIYLEAFDMVEGIIEKYVEKNKKSRPSTREKETLISQSKKSLWVLAYFLMYWEPGRPIEINQVYNKVYNDLIGLDNKYGINGSHYVILALSPFYSYEIRVKRPFLTKRLKLDDLTIKKLLEVGEIRESNGFLSLYHSAIAEIYIKTGERYIELIDSLLEELRDFNENFSAKEDYMINIFRYYLGGYKPENYAEVLTRLRYEERLINDILSDKNSFFAIYDLVTLTLLT